MKLNNESGFDVLVNEALGSYVYVLQDPKDGVVFYIGKAGGKLSQGNQRVHSHFEEAREARKRKAEGCTDAVSEKVNKILAIWDRGDDVKWLIIRRNLRDEQEALNVEAAAIDLLKVSSAPNPLNIQVGHRASEHGMLDENGVKSLMAKNFDAEKIPKPIIGKVIILFNIKNALKEEINKGDVYQAARKSWKMGTDIRNTAGVIAIGVVDQISYGAWEISGWEKSKEHPNKWEFLKNDLSPDVSDSLIWKNFNKIISLAYGYWKQGNPIAFKINEVGQINFVRGSKLRKNTWTQF